MEKITELRQKLAGILEETNSPTFIGNVWEIVNEIQRIHDEE